MSSTGITPRRPYGYRIMGNGCTHASGDGYASIDTASKAAEERLASLRERPGVNISGVYVVNHLAAPREHYQRKYDITLDTWEKM